MMAAVNLTTSTKRGATFEFLRIVESASGLSYLASPGGKAPVEFKLKTLGEKRVVFENLAHDFPQRRYHQAIENRRAGCKRLEVSGMLEYFDEHG